MTLTSRMKNIYKYQDSSGQSYFIGLDESHSFSPHLPSPFYFYLETQFRRHTKTFSKSRGRFYPISSGMQCLRMEEFLGIMIIFIMPHCVCPVSMFQACAKHSAWVIIFKFHNNPWVQGVI